MTRCYLAEIAYQSSKANHIGYVTNWLKKEHKPRILDEGNSRKPTQKQQHGKYDDTIVARLFDTGPCETQKHQADSRSSQSREAEHQGSYRNVQSLGVPEPKCQHNSVEATD